MSYSPYAPPQHPQSPYGAPGGHHEAFRPLGWKTTAVVLTVAATTALSILLGIVGAVGPALPKNLVVALGVVLLSLFSMVCGLAASVFFLVWEHHAATNVRSFGHVGLAFEPGWCVAWWFIPIAGLWKSYQAMKEIWRASDPNGVGTGRPDGFLTVGVPGYFLPWWLLYMVAGTLVTAGSLGQTYANVQHTDPMTANVVLAVGQLMNAVAAVFCILIVRRIDENQRASAERTGAPNSLAAPRPPL